MFRKYERKNNYFILSKFFFQDEHYKIYYYFILKILIYYSPKVSFTTRILITSMKSIRSYRYISLIFDARKNT